MISKSKLIHHKIQAALRENSFSEDELKYLGERSPGQHWYLVAGKYEVNAEEIEEFEQVEGLEEPHSEPKDIECTEDLKCTNKDDPHRSL